MSLLSALNNKSLLFSDAEADVSAVASAGACASACADDGTYWQVPTGMCNMICVVSFCLFASFGLGAASASGTAPVQRYPVLVDAAALDTTHRHAAAAIASPVPPLISSSIRIFQQCQHTHGRVLGCPTAS